MLDHFAVVRLVKEGADALGDDGADIGHLQQLRFGRVHDAVEPAKMARQRLGSRLADMPDAQAENKARQRGVLGLFQRCHQVVG